jgi:hypothetical protein
MVTEAEELCETILRIFSNTSQKFDSNYEMIGRLDKETQDLLHEIELAEVKDTDKGYNLYVTLREIRRNRRQLRDENELLQPLVDLLKENEKFRQKLFKICSRIKEIERQQGERMYKARVRDDLTICGNDEEEVS